MGLIVSLPIPKIIYWSPTLRIWPYVKIESLQMWVVKMMLLECALTQYDWYLFLLITYSLLALVHSVCNDHHYLVTEHLYNYMAFCVWFLNMTGVFIKEGNFNTETYTGRMPCQDEGRDWSDVSTSQGLLTIANKPPGARGKAWNRSSS